MARDHAVYMRPKDDSYAAFKAFIDNFVQALSPDKAPEEEDAEDEALTREAYRAYLDARRQSGEPLVGAEELPEE